MYKYVAFYYLYIIANLETCAKSIKNKKLSCRKETVRLLHGSVSAKM